MNTLAGEGVQEDGGGGGEGLTFTGLHLGDCAGMEHLSADQLDVVVALAQVATGRLARQGEGFGEQIVE